LGSVFISRHSLDELLHLEKHHDLLDGCFCHWARFGQLLLKTLAETVTFKKYS
jgi:CO dehydrogenase nickel-insertion accessory protein CooC1